jgi:hypothetical protein
MFYSTTSKLIFIFVVSLLIPFCAENCGAQSGGQFVIEQSVIASGGITNSSGGAFANSGTIGQTVAGQKATTVRFSLHAGFWNSSPFVPTAATVSIGGRILTVSGTGIRNVRITLTSASGETRYSISSAFGYYHFPDVPVGDTYILTASAKRFVFAIPTQVVTLFKEREDIDFTAENTF